MFSRQRLFWHRGPYDLPSTDQLFLQATADCCAFHMARCPQYRAIAEHLGFSPDQLRTMDDLVRVPMLPTLFFKRHALFSMPRRRMVMKVTSSGTSGTFSQVGFDLGCIWAEVPMVLRLGWRHRLISFRPANYVVLGYKPDRRSSAGVTRTMFGMTFFAPPLRRFYALRWQGEGYVPDLDGRAGHLPAPAARFQDPAGRGLEAALAAAGGQVSALLPGPAGAGGGGGGHP